MADPAGILLHLKLIAASHDLIEALTKPRAIPGTQGEQRTEVARRVKAYGAAYNASLRWAKSAAKVIEAMDRG